MNFPIEILVARAIGVFKAHFDHSPACVVQAPGRVNLIGEHTDYNEGFVLPCAINYRTVVACRRRDDALVRVLAVDNEMEVDIFRLDLPIARRADRVWANYVRGVVHELLAYGLEFGGLDMVVSGDVPQGAGLSSSASLEVAVAQAIMSTFGFEGFNATQLAQAAQRAENHFVGCNCGIMDQLVVAHGLAGHALLIDCRSLQTRQVELPPDVSVLVVHSRVPRGLVDSEYNRRREQCEAAAAHFGVLALRDVSPEEVMGNRSLDGVLRRRARHVVSENQRTQETANALARGDMRQMGQLMAESHISMRDDFEITVPPIDRLVEILQSVIADNGGARMTGGGFGGCVVAVLPHGLVEPACEAVAARYRGPNGEPAIFYECVASAGAGSLSI